MAIDKVQVGVIGMPIYFHFIDPDTDDPIDLTTVDSMVGRLSSPTAYEAGTAADTVPLTVSGSATLGIGVYTTLTVNDIDEAGTWHAQGYATFDATHIYPSEVVRFIAESNLPIT